jgi:multimeric flavodoxin WrbA
MKTLVAYYSLTGNTEKVAKAIAEALSADIERIRDAKLRAGGGGNVRSGFEAFLKLTPAILPAVKSVADYGLVIVGCPVWGQNMASPMRAYLKRERGKIRRLAVFCTQEGSGGERALRQMAALVGVEPIGNLVASAQDLSSGQCRTVAKKFAEQVREGLLAARVGTRAA